MFFMSRKRYEESVSRAVCKACNEERDRFYQQRRMDEFEEKLYKIRAELNRLSAAEKARKTPVPVCGDNPPECSCVEPAPVPITGE